ncbi:glycoside hydrolase family 66 protein [Leifsonia virtsii]|uniref:Glycoside hydrolase family 66 protein n=1 Tax=Leifsonia virtsii TaxID=3035915 RepID=A0ABT8IWK5_9MICO|nr:glycoside hydrolase family 66 protein [Leifsonia virtsii]MDN4597190.1 glycoside hydrolase family 66 protein [Leifsonia virtsii]
MSELLPERAWFGPGQEVRVELRGVSEPGELTLWHLGERLTSLPTPGDGFVTLGSLPPGGYGLEWTDGTGAAPLRSALHIAGADALRLRYGFTVDYSPGRDPGGLVDTVRRLHLTDVQFYDWAYRHADLLGGGEDYEDALGQPVSLATVRRLIEAVRGAGARALGYAAVYAVGPAEWQDWRQWALLDAASAPFALGDFLFIVDPAAVPWLSHLRTELAAAVDRVGFDGFHLDQYGYPKHARRADGHAVDVAQSFAALIEGVRDRLPGSHLVFNNVNDFPTWTTAASPQDAVYIEVWDPHVTLGSLAAVVTRARAAGGDKPIAIAAYQHVYDSAPADAADRATAFTMATLFSHGATQLLAGEADRILVDPYYVRNHVVEPSTADLLRRWYDFMVEHDELLFDPGNTDVTGSYAGPYNDDLDVAYEKTPVGGEAASGTVWRRVVQTPRGLLVHLINLAGQPDDLWDAPKEPVADIGNGSLRIRATAGSTPRVRVAGPDALPRLVDVEVTVDGTHATALLPAPGTWQLVLIDLDPKDTL